MKRKLLALAIIIIIFYSAKIIDNKIKFDDLIKKSIEGNAASQVNLGKAYEDGINVSQDYVKAFEWYEKAALQGNSDGQFNLGSLYFLGRGINQDYEKAVGWFEKSALQGNAEGQNWLGISYMEGLGINQDHIIASIWFERAASEGLFAAKENLKTISEIIKKSKNTNNNTKSDIDTLKGTWYMVINRSNLKYEINDNELIITERNPTASNNETHWFFNINSQSHCLVCNNGYTMITNRLSNETSNITLNPRTMNYSIIDNDHIILFGNELYRAK